MTKDQQEVFDLYWNGIIKLGLAVVVTLVWLGMLGLLLFAPSLASGSLATLATFPMWRVAAHYFPNRDRTKIRRNGMKGKPVP